MEKFNVYQDIAARTGGEIYVGVVGPVRTGKSTFIKRFMEQLVLPQVTGAKKQRMTDELPQAASGKTVMTTEPKFVPEEAAELQVKDAVVKVRLIDCVGFPVEGANGFEEDGVPRLVKTPWREEAVSFAVAAKEGTQKVICDHATIGILMTSDGTVTGLPREAYVEAEELAARELASLKKPYVILINCQNPSEAEDLRAELEEKYAVPVVAVNAEKMTAEDILSVLERILYEFPVSCIDFDVPDWVRVLDGGSSLIQEIMQEIRVVAPKICKMSDCYLLDGLFAQSSRLLPSVQVSLQPATGRVVCKIQAQSCAFYEMISEQCGEEIKDDFALMHYVSALAEAKKLHARISQAFDDAREYGYGIVPPEGDEMCLNEPKVVKKSGRIGVNLRANAPSYHIIRVDVNGEVHPTLGNREQSEAFVKELVEGMATQPDRAWNTTMFGKTIKELLGEELYVKNRSMAEHVQKKMRRTVTRIVNEGKGGVICILL